MFIDLFTEKHICFLQKVFLTKYWFYKNRDALGKFL